jgi:hypothetical protein
MRLIPSLLFISAIGSAPAQAAIGTSMFGRAKRYRKDQQ